MALLDPTKLDLNDVQGYILRGYRMDLARHFVLQITDVGGAREFLGAVVAHEPALHAQLVNRQPDTIPQITTAADWGATKPDYCLNIGFTAPGLSALQVQTQTFPADFTQGAASRNVVVGDATQSQAQNWIGKLDPANAQHAHIVLSLYALSSEILERTTICLRDLFSQNKALTELSCFDAAALESYQHVPRSCDEHDPRAFPKVHFGYTDGIAQPTIQGAPPTLIPDDQSDQPVALGEFLLGYPDSSGGGTVLQPAELGQNGSFAAFLILEQDVDGFEALLSRHESATLSKELLAAKLCGRWRNGVPLALSPTTDTPDPPITLDTINQFRYVSNAPKECDDPQEFHDPYGINCPIGSHIRRTNPRDENIAGVVKNHRIVRRAMAYGPPYDPAQPNDGKERGLVGLFINASLTYQFEFLMQNWVNGATFTWGLTTPDMKQTYDALIGNNESNSGQFIIRQAPQPTQPTVISGLSSLVTTRGIAYVFLPSITALRYLANSAHFADTAS